MFGVAKACEASPKLVGDCAAVVALLTFDATALPVQDLRFAAEESGLRLDIDILVPDRDKDEAVVITRAVMMPWEPLEGNGADYIVGWVRETLANFMAHEVSEGLLYNGERVFDPHRRFTIKRVKP